MIKNDSNKQPRGGAAKTLVYTLSLAFLLCACPLDSGEEGVNGQEQEDLSWQTGEIRLVDEPESGNFFDTAPPDANSPPSGPAGYEAAWCYYEAETTTTPNNGPIAPPWVTEGHRGKGIDLDNGRIHTQLRFINPVAGHPGDFDFSSGEVTLNTWICWRGKGGRKALGEGEDKYNINDQNQVIFSLSGGSNLLKLGINDDQNNANGDTVKNAAIFAASGKRGLMAKVAPASVSPAPDPVPLVPNKSLDKEEWHMVTLTFDGASAALFIDGEEQKRENCTTWNKWNGNPVTLDKFNVAMFRMGGSFYGPPTLNAVIDDASYWKKALSAQAIKSLYDHTKTDSDTLNENNTDTGPAPEVITDPIQVAPYAPVVSAADRCIVGVSRENAAIQDFHNSGAANWLESHNGLVAEMEADPAADIVFIGDSITNRWESTPGIDAWNELKTKYGNLVNLGIGGDLTQNVIWRLENGEYPETGFEPGYVMLLIGTNNTGGRSNAASIAAGIAKIIEIVHGRSPDAEIILFSILPRNWNSDDADLKAFRPPLIGQVNEILAGYDEQPYVRYYDLGQFFVNQDGSFNAALFADGLHLNSTGYGIWKDKIIEILGGE